MKTRLLKLAPLAGLAALLGTAGLAGAQTAIDVHGTVGVSSRQLFVEDLLGNDLTSFDFGTGGAIPFQVRVEDESVALTGFTVDATMTNLYRDTGAALVFGDLVPSGNLSLGALATPVSVLDDVIAIEATITPLFNTTTTINNLALCTALGTLAATCELATAGVAGVAQTVTFGPDDLVDLSKLPIVPQAPEAGAFTLPDFEGDQANPADTAADPAAAGAPAATALQVLGGGVINVANLDLITQLLDTQLGPLANLTAAARDALIPVASYTAAVQNAAATLVPGLSLSGGQLATILGGTTTLDVLDLDLDAIISQTGAYRSFPVLQLAIPGSTPAGAYRGTLVITDIQP